VTKIVRKKTEIETIDSINNPERETNSKHIPHKFPINMPVKMNFLCDKIETHDKSQSTACNKRNEDKNNSVKIYLSGW
jgi:hypothetical protein